MKAPIFSLLAFVLCISTNAQRFLSTVRDPANPQNQTGVVGGKVIVAGHTDNFLLSYNDVAFTSFTYPIVSGIQLKFDTYNNPLVSYKLALYFKLATTPGSATTVYLYRFSGSAFTRILLPGPVISNCIVYNNNLYFLCDVSGWRTLYRYDGTTATALSSVPASGNYKLLVTEGFLYIAGYGTAGGTMNFIQRYNGTSAITLPYSGAGTLVQDAYGVPGTSNVYFTSHERIIYYNGSTVTQVFFNTGESVYARMWRNSLYFTTGVTPSSGPRTNYLYRLTGPTLTLMSLPAGASIATVPHTNPEVFRDELYVAMVFTDGAKRVMKYNGSMYFAVYNITGPVSGSGVRLALRSDKLLIQPNFGNDNYAVEFDGFDFVNITGVTGRLMFPWLNGTNCNHIWLNYYSDAGGIHWAFAKESLSCPPPPGPPAPPAIPEGVMDFESFSFNPYGQDRGWCWSEIIIDWVIVPYCPLPCPLPDYEVRMINANNAIAWSKKFNTPSVLQVPLPDVQGYKTTLYSTALQRDLLVFEANLVEKGIVSVKIDMKPKQNYFTLTAVTKNNMQVPLMVTLTDAKGNAIWSKSFTAPFSQVQVADRVQQQGKALVFSVPDLIF